ncbi:MAG: hypothetical protein M5U22_16125 [Thermoleophilia bacterium]|nr:hypothetical protein [Thermoleophilia bacterium]
MEPSGTIRVMDDVSYRTLRPGRVVVIEYRPDDDTAQSSSRGNQPLLSWAIYLGERFEEDGPRGWFGLPDGGEIDDRQILWHFIPLGPSDHPETQAAFLRRLRLRTISLRAAHRKWFPRAFHDAGNR